MDDIYTPPGGPPQDGPPSPEILKVLGEEGIRKLLSLHYKNLEHTSIRDMFARDMEVAAQRAADFFIQIMGGTPYYSQKNGPPMMRKRHMPFPITEESRQVWLDCFRQAMKDLPFPEEYADNFDHFLDSFSAWMVNRKS